MISNILFVVVNCCFVFDVIKTIRAYYKMKKLLGFVDLINNFVDSSLLIARTRHNVFVVS